MKKLLLLLVATLCLTTMKAQLAATEQFSSLNEVKTAHMMGGIGFALRSTAADGWLSRSGEILPELTDECLFFCNPYAGYGMDESKDDVYSICSMVDKGFVQQFNLNGSDSSVDDDLWFECYVMQNANEFYTRLGLFTAKVAEAGSNRPRERTENNADQQANGRNVVICCDKLSLGGVFTYLAANKEYKRAYYTREIDANQWEIWGVSNALPAEILSETLGKYFPYGLTREVYSVGSNPGQVPEEVFQQAEQVYSQALEMLTSGTATNEEYTEMNSRVAEIARIFKESMLPMREGFFIVHDTRNPHHWAYAKDGKWSVKSSYTEPETVGLADIPYIWEIRKGEVEGTWTLRSFSNNLYVAASGTQGLLNFQEAPEAWTINRAEWGVASDESPSGMVDYGTFNINSTVDKNFFWCSETQYIGWWRNRDAAALCWQFVELDPQQIENMAGEVEKARLREDLEKLVKAAKNTVSSNILYASSATTDGNFSDIGLVTEGAQLSSNAAKVSEGALDFLIDGDYTTYFHTTWNVDLADEVPDQPHYVQADLEEAVQTLQIKYAKRVGHLDECNPTEFQVYATNDPNGEWQDVGRMTLTYTIAYDYKGDGTPTANLVGLSGIEMPEAFRHVRLACTDRINGTSSNLVNGFPFWYLSELHFYKAVLDKENSAYYAVTESVRQDFEQALTQAETLLESGEVTEEKVEAFRAAYKALLSELPTPEMLYAVMEEAEGILAGAVPIGTGYGYYPEEALDGLQAAITKHQSSVENAASLTREEIVAAAQEVEQAINTFYGSIILPAAGSLVTLHSEDTGLTPNARLYATSSALDDALRVETMNLDADYDLDYRSTLTCLWRVVTSSADGFSLQNLGTGLFLGSAEADSRPVQQSREEHLLSVRSAGVGGVLRFKLNDKLYLSHNSGKNVLASSRENDYYSHWHFEDVPYSRLDSDGAYMWPITAGGKVQILTLPVDVSDVYGGTIYTLVGQNANNELVLQEATESVKAGEPFIFLAEEAEDSWATFFLADMVTADALPVYATEAKEVNGLQATLFLPAEVKVGEGVLYDGAVVVLNEDSGEQLSQVPTNSGYFTGLHPQNVEEAGDLRIPIANTPMWVGVAPVQAASPAAAAIFTLSGVRVAKTCSLPAGIYIQGGKKIVVK